MSIIAINRHNLKRTLRLAIAMLMVGVLSSCASGAKQQIKENSDLVIEASSDQLSSLAEQIEVDPNLPKLELDAETLEQLLVYNLASYQADWELASEKALQAALSSRDYRLARIATLLALRNSDYEMALQGAQLWYELNQSSPDVVNMRLIAQMGAGYVEEALNFLELHAQGKPFNQHIRQVAGLMVRQNNGQAALEIAKRYVQRHPDSAQVSLSMAFVAETFKDMPLAEQWLEAALALRPDWDLAAQMKANMLGRLGRSQERADFIKAYIKAHPHSVTMRINHAAELARTRQYEEALDLMQQVLPDDPENVNALSYAGALAQQLRKVALAKDYYRKALAIDPSDDDIRWSLARMAAIEKNYKEAERLFAGIQSQESYISAQTQVANMRYHTQGIDSSLRTLSLLEPETEDEYVEIALTRHYLLLQANQYDEALGYINDALIYSPDNLDLLYARALVAAELKKIDIAESDFRTIIKNQPDHANALNALGYTLADQTERFDEALVLITKALELSPNEAHILDSMGWVQYRLNNFSEAIAYLERAYAASTEVEIAAHLGEVLWESGEQERAREVWRKSFDVDSNNQLLNETLKRYNINFSVPDNSAQSK